jgi:hypothetical protein
MELTLDGTVDSNRTESEERFGNITSIGKWHLQLTEFSFTSIRATVSSAKPRRLLALHLADCLKHT